jgi:hypothetical protein
MTSLGFPPTRNASGIFSTDPSLSPFASANKVYIPYCSSDAYVGNVGKDREDNMSATVVAAGGVPFLVRQVLAY